ncbi:C-_U-editing enzyme APOBEC-1 [Lemmus lemmus]
MGVFLCFRRRIEPQEFEDFFDPRELRKETCLLYEISWGGRHSIWRHTGRNTDKHVEINFLEKLTSEGFFHPSTRCSITWFLSWSPCGECSRAITEFLSRHPNVTLFIYVARLYHHMDPRNRQGLRDLICRGVTVQIMTEQGENRLVLMVWCW